MDIRPAPTTQGLPWKSHRVAKAPELPGSLASPSHPLDSIKLLRSLLDNAGRVHPHSSLPSIKQLLAHGLTAPIQVAGASSHSSLTTLKHQLKFFVRGLATPQLTQNWFELWQTPKLAPLLAGHPRVLLKLQRPYLQQRLDAGSRWEILRQHYSFATEHFTAAALREMFIGAGVLLASLPAMEAGHFSLRLLYDNLFEKEGELSLVFYEEQKQRPLFALTFCVSCCEPGRREIFIGGLQGYKGANPREYVVSITREMFGLRPKALLLFALQQCAALWNIRSLRAVSNQTRVHRSATSIKADYDEFWLDSSGQLEADGNFTLPVTFTPRELTNIKPNKRAMYRHRYWMLDDLATQIRRNVNRLEGSALAVGRVAPTDDVMREGHLSAFPEFILANGACRMD